MKINPIISNKEKKQWLLDCIYVTTYNDLDGEKNITDNCSNKEKLQYVAERLKSEAFYIFNIQRFKGNNQAIISDHLMGLPSWINIPYSNFDILQLAKKWGYDVTTEKKEDNFLAHYWGAVASLILQLFNKEGIAL